MSTDLPPEREEEETILFIRKHWYLILIPILWVFLGLLVVLIVLRLGGASIYFTITFFAWLIIGGTYLFVKIYVWYRSVYIITNERVIRREQKGLFSKKISELDLANIHNVTTEISGVVAAAFNFGDVILQSFGVQEAVKLKSVANPSKIQAKISQILKEYNQEYEEEDRENKEEKDEEAPSKPKKSPEKYVPRKPKIEEE